MIPAIVAGVNNGASRVARERGEMLERFFAARGSFYSIGDLLTYLDLRCCDRYTITVLPMGVVLFELPPEKLRIMQDAHGKRPPGITWCVRSLRWWQRGKVIKDWLADAHVVA